MIQLLLLKLDLDPEMDDGTITRISERQRCSL
jgi:hypothetical protein